MMNGISIAPSLPNRVLIAYPMDRIEVGQDQEVKGVSIWKVAFMNILEKNRVTELKYSIPKKHKSAAMA